MLGNNLRIRKDINLQLPLFKTNYEYFKTITSPNIDYSITFSYECFNSSRCMSVDFSYSPKYHSTVSYSPSSSELKGIQISYFMEKKKG